MGSKTRFQGTRSITGLSATKPAVLSIVKLLFVMIANLPFLRAAPLGLSSSHKAFEDDGKSPKDPSLWIYLGTAVSLVLLGGAFAGLTIALMGQDEIYLQVIHTSGDGKERKHAGAVLRLLKRGKHWVLVTLLLSNVITNETLPIVLDRSLGGGWPAVLSSTVLIVIFGEIIPQSICVRYGLPIGAYLSPLVLGLMYILAPVAWPTAKLLDYLLGEDHGTVYKKAGLKTLVTLHKSLGPSPGDRLNEDEVTIISAVLDLKDKPVGSIMTPMEDVFTMSGDTILDEKTMDVILSAGYSRIPIHAPDNPLNFIGMLLVKILITYDPEDAKKVSDFALATLPETRPETSCLDIVNYFQEGKSHMVLVTDYPGENYGALGVVTLEDVIEELIGEEIIDESDVYIDVHKAIRRIAPAPKARVPKGAFVAETDGKTPVESNLVDIMEDHETTGDDLDRVLSSMDARQTADGKMTVPASSVSEFGSSPKNNFMYRRSSSNAGSAVPQTLVGPISPEMMAHLKHLGPSNLASKPKQTKYTTVKIKPGATQDDTTKLKRAIAEEFNAKGSAATPAPHGSAGPALAAPTSRDVEESNQSLQKGYGGVDGSTSPKTRPQIENKTNSGNLSGDTNRPVPTKSRSHSTIGSLRSQHSSRSPSRHRGIARSGSISENVIDVGGVRKVVLETTSSSEEADEANNGKSTNGSSSNLPNNNVQNQSSSQLVSGGESTGGGDPRTKKKRRKKRRGHGSSETQPLLEGNR